MTTTDAQDRRSRDFELFDAASDFRVEFRRYKSLRSAQREALAAVERQTEEFRDGDFVRLQAERDHWDAVYGTRALSDNIETQAGECMAALTRLFVMPAHSFAGVREKYRVLKSLLLDDEDSEQSYWQNSPGEWAESVARDLDRLAGEDVR